MKQKIDGQAHSLLERLSCAQAQLPHGRRDTEAEKGEARGMPGVVVQLPPTLCAGAEVADYSPREAASGRVGFRSAGGGEAAAGAGLQQRERAGGRTDGRHSAGRAGTTRRDAHRQVGSRGLGCCVWGWGGRGRVALAREWGRVHREWRQQGGNGDCGERERELRTGKGEEG